MSKLRVQSVASSRQAGGLPVGWVVAYIRTISNIVYGKGLPQKKISKCGKYPVFGANSIIGYYDQYLYEKRQVLISCRGANSGTINISPKNCFVTSNSLIVQLPDVYHDELYKFIFYSLNLANKENIVTGSAQPQVTINNLTNLYILLPPLNEQKRIAARLDQIILRIDKVKERLDKMPQIIKRFRQSVLTNAVTGKLTEDWREKHPDVESAEVLLERIREDRENRYKKACEEAEKAGARKPKKYRENLTEIAEKVQIKTWKWVFLSNICNITGGVTKGRNLQKYNTISLPYLRVANVQDGYLDLNEIKEIEIKKNEFKKYELIEGDILFTEGGDRDKLGRGCVWKNEIHNCIHQNHIFKARLNQKLIFSKYVSFATKSEFSKAYFDTVANQTVNLASINMTNLGDLPILLPPLEEQKEIVRQVDKLFTLADKLESHYKKAKDRVDKLSQSVLAKAFRGELVMNEAELAKKEGREFESAEMLLERIKIEKVKMEAAMKAAKKRKTRKN